MHCPSREKPGHARVTKKATAWVSKCPSKTFFEERIRKIPSEIPNHCRTIAAANAANGSKVIFKRSTWRKGLQAVLKDSCLVNTLWKTTGLRYRLFVAKGGHGIDRGGLVRRKTRSGNG
jgi:hypothetical protein